MVVVPASTAPQLAFTIRRLADNVGVLLGQNHFLFVELGHRVGTRRNVVAAFGRRHVFH
ncbi:hypothetical protein D3C80_1758940 [compost metagenome]